MLFESYASGMSRFFIDLGVSLAVTFSDFEVFILFSSVADTSFEASCWFSVASDASFTAVFSNFDVSV